MGNTVCVKSLLRSRKHVSDSLRKRRAGGGRRFANPLVRQELYHWWCSIRYAIDWQQLIAENRSRGGTGKKNLARFPRSILLVKVWQLQTEYAHASLLSGEDPLFPAKLLVALPMAGRIWSLHAKSQSQVRGAESRAERAHGAFLGQSLQDPIVYKVGIWV